MHVRPFGGDFELKILRMRGFSSRFLDNQPENCCTTKPDQDFLQLAAVIGVTFTPFLLNFPQILELPT